VKALIIVVFGLFVFQTETYLDWNERRKLSWSDFQAEPPVQSAHAALTNSGINLDLMLQNKEFNVKVHARFNPDKSWKRRDIENSEYLLAHEQLHFDLTELYARKLRKAFLTRKWKENENVNAIFNELYQSNQDQLWKVQDIYDAETEHSINREAQAKWNRAIADSLEMFKDFDKPEIRFFIE
jgi:hypothetical protein